MNSINSLEEKDISGKRVIVRCDFNVSLDEERVVLDDLRVRQAVPTINYLTERGARVVLISHFGKDSIYPVKNVLSGILGKEVFFIKDCVGEEVKERIDEMKNSDVLLLENVRTYDEEKENSVEFGEKISLLGDIFVNDAFSVSHRKHSSVFQVPKFLKSFSGLLMEKEIEALKKIKNNPEEPVIVLIGGSKIESKTKAIKTFLGKGYIVLLGGKVANSVMSLRGVIPEDFKGKISNPEDLKDTVKRSSNLHTPTDVVVLDQKKEVKEKKVDEVYSGDNIFDLGSETYNFYGDLIKTANTILWVGPLGFFEKDPFHKSTEKIAKNVTDNLSAVKVCGGGDTNAALKKLNFLDKMDVVSYGGGAMLAYLTEEELPGLKVLNGYY